jgi:hypothetical protein
MEADIFNHTIHYFEEIIINLTIITCFDCLGTSDLLSFHPIGCSVAEE